MRFLFVYFCLLWGFSSYCRLLLLLPSLLLYFDLIAVSCVHDSWDDLLNFLFESFTLARLSAPDYRSTHNSLQKQLNWILVEFRTKYSHRYIRTLHFLLTTTFIIAQSPNIFLAGITRMVTSSSSLAVISPITLYP